MRSGRKQKKTLLNGGQAGLWKITRKRDETTEHLKVKFNEILILLHICLVFVNNYNISRDDERTQR